MRQFQLPFAWALAALVYVAVASTQPGSVGVSRWSYADGAGGPAAWAGLTREGSGALAFPGCAQSVRPQSPVALEATAEARFTPQCGTL